MERARVSIIVPAHNEAAVIARGLERLRAGAEPDELEIVVVCNGCTDATASIARATAPDATVVELDEASKAAALNEGDRRATRFPRFYVDADVELGIKAVRATAQVLDDGVLCAAPVPRFDPTGCPWYVRSFYRVFTKMPFMSGPGVVGTGVYALSETGRRRFVEFPAITADDQFVMDRFATSERRAVTSASFTVHPPRDLRGLVAVRTRVYRGNAELRTNFEPVEAPEPSTAGGLLRLLVRPSTALGVPVYIGVNLAARARAKRAWNGVWERDQSTR